jgi:hypothetical protein
LETGKIVSEVANLRYPLGYEPSVSDGRVIAASGSIFVKADPTDLRATEKIETPYADCSASALAGGRFFLRMDRRLACYDIRK